MLTKIKFRLRAAGVVLFVCLTLLVAAPASAGCQPPNFRTGQDYGISVFVSLQPRDFTIEKLACLAQALRDSRQERKSFGVFFFDSDEAAMNWKPSYGDDDGISPRLFRAKERWAKAFHAFYSFEGDKNEETLDILPVGHHSPSLQNKLHLPLVPEWHCQSEIQNRCLIAAMEKITYPQGVLKARASGVVELTGTVDRNGRVTGVHVVDASVRLGAEKAQLANEAARDLKTWRFDAGGHDDPIRIVYSFEFDASLPRGGRAEVEWVSPNQVKVRANSPK